MTKLETTIRQVSDLRDFYMKIKKEKRKNHQAGTSPTDTAHRKPVFSATLREARRGPGTSTM